MSQSSIDLARALSGFAEQHGFEAPGVAWINASFSVTGADGNAINCDPSADWCSDCAETVVGLARDQSVEGASELIVDGGWDGQEGDGCRTCHCCGRLLDYELTEDGVRAELEHFAQEPIEDMTPSLAFEISRILYADEESEAACSLGAAAVAAIEAGRITVPEAVRPGGM